MATGIVTTRGAYLRLDLLQQGDVHNFFHRLLLDNLDSFRIGRDCSKIYLSLTPCSTWLVTRQAYGSPPHRYVTAAQMREAPSWDLSRGAPGSLNDDHSWEVSGCDLSGKTPGFVTFLYEDKGRKESFSTRELGKIRKPSWSRQLRLSLSALAVS
jgi:hypothetical protein